MAMNLCSIDISLQFLSTPDICPRTLVGSALDLFGYTRDVDEIAVKCRKKYTKQVLQKNAFFANIEIGGRFFLQLGSSLLSLLFIDNARRERHQAR